MKLHFSLLLSSVLLSSTPVCALTPFEENRQASTNKALADRSDWHTSMGCLAEPKSKLDARNSILLHVYVTKELEPSALELEAEHYNRALKLIGKQSFRSQIAVDESHYIKALSLQALGRFDECIGEFNLLTSRDCFIDKAKTTIGRANAATRTRAVSFEQIRFPSYSIAPGF
jgi:hypothetical protein